MRLNSRMLSDGMTDYLIHIDWQGSLCLRQGCPRAVAVWSEPATARSLGHIPTLTGHLGGKSDQCFH